MAAQASSAGGVVGVSFIQRPETNYFLTQFVKQNTKGSKHFF